MGWYALPGISAVLLLCGQEMERIEQLRSEAQAEMEASKAKHGLGFVKVEASTLKPTIN